MLRPLITIVFTQMPSPAYPQRSDVLTMPFVTDCEINSSWKNLTDTAKLKFPKNVAVKLPDGSRVNLSSTPTAAGIPVIGKTGSQQTPFLLRGDKISITAGYKFYDAAGNEKVITNEIFTGYVTKVQPKMPIEIECEDNMYLLKQLQAPNKLFPASKYDAGKIISELISGTGLSVNTNGESTSVGDFRTENETVSQVIERFRKNYRIECWFRGSELRVASIVYFPNDATQSVFVFQKNIISDELEYTRADDVKLGIRAYSINKVELTSVNKNGHTQTKHKRLEVFATKTNGKIVTTVISSANENAFFGKNDYGEIRTLYFWNISDTKKLAQLASDNLNRFYYEGFRGSFTTFGLPYVKHGDQVLLKDNLLPERNGTYFVKGVTYNYGMGGFRQKIELDMRIDGVLSNDQIAAGV